MDVVKGDELEDGLEDGLWRIFGGSGLQFWGWYGMRSLIRVGFGCEVGGVEMGRLLLFVN